MVFESEEEEEVVGGGGVEKNKVEQEQEQEQESSTLKSREFTKNNQTQQNVNSSEPDRRREFDKLLNNLSFTSAEDSMDLFQVLSEQNKETKKAIPITGKEKEETTNKEEILSKKPLPSPSNKPKNDEKETEKEKEKEKEKERGDVCVRNVE